MKTVKMIAVDHRYKSESYWRGDDLCDTKREKEHTVKFFGVTLFHKKEDFIIDTVDDNKRPLGFKK